MSTNAHERKLHVLLHYWNEGVRSVPELAGITKLPVPTVRYNVKKLKKTGTLEHRGVMVVRKK